MIENDLNEFLFVIASSYYQNYSRRIYFLSPYRT